MRSKTGWSDRDTSPENKRVMKEEATRSGIPIGILEEIEQCKEEPTMAHGPGPVLWWFFKPMVVGALWLLPLTIATANVTKWVRDLPPEADWLPRTGRTILQGLILLATAAALLWIRQYYQRVKSWKKQKDALAEREKVMRTTRPASGRPDPNLRPKLLRAPTHDLRTMAAYICRLVDVPYVTFGHTHYADIYNLDDQAPNRSGGGASDTSPAPDPVKSRWYFNTGTWMAIFEPREQLYREARQLTFLEITRTSSGIADARLLCWYPPRNDSRPVVVVDMEELDNSVENGILMSAIRGIGGLGGGRR
jgi:hypothetical protein